MRLLVAAGLLAAAAPGATVEVDAGNYDRRLTPLAVELPRDLRGATHLALGRADTGRRVDVQRLGDRAVWILEAPLAAGEKRRYRLTAASSPAEADVKTVDDGKTLTLRVGEKPVLVYRQTVVESPPGIEKHFRKSGYIHPLYNPSGQAVTDDFPPDHAHQHAVFFAWVNSTFEGREVDFWNQAKGTGDVRHQMLQGVKSGSVFAEFVTELTHVDLTAPGGEKAALTETWKVRVWDISEHFLVDLVSEQRTAGSSALRLNEYRYGGMATRGAREWFKQEGSNFLTSEGASREDGNHTRPVWVESYGKIDGRPSGFVAMGSPENFRFPQPVRLHPSKPYFCFSPMVLGEFSIEPGETYRSAYRFYVHDGAPDPAQNDHVWRDYSEPPRVTVR